MKISFLLMNGHGLSGGDRVVALHAADLRRKGHDVRLFAPQPPPDPLRGRLRRVRRGGAWRLQPPPTETHYSTQGLDVEFLDRHRPIQTADLPDADLVIATWWETAEWMAALPEPKGRKVHLIQDHEVFPYLPVDRVAAVYRRPFRRIVVSEWLRRAFSEIYEDTDCLLVPNGVDSTFFRKVPRERTTTFKVGFLHAESPRKNIPLALEIVARLRAKLPQASVLCFGSSRPDPDGLPAAAEFHFRPPQARIPDLYAACDVWLFTSESEGFGLPILEAMACGTPVLATRAGAAPEILGTGGGRLLDPDPDRFAEALLEIARLPEADWQALSAAARRTAERWDWATSHALFEQALTEIVETAPKAPHRLRPQARIATDHLASIDRNTDGRNAT